MPFAWMKKRNISFTSTTSSLGSVPSDLPVTSFLPSFTGKNLLYRNAIIQAIEQLHDFNLRSNIESIRRHVQSTLGPEHIWNDTLFHKTMKTLTSEGKIVTCTTVNYALSPEFKRKRTQSCNAALEQHRSHERHHSMPGNYHYAHHLHHPEHEKELPAKKTEHTKLKIIRKKIYEGLQ
jgi:hypothetical protein